MLEDRGKLYDKISRTSFATFWGLLTIEGLLQQNLIPDFLTYCFFDSSVAFKLLQFIDNFESEYIKYRCAKLEENKDIKILYEEFINSYVKLNKTFNLDDPIKIFTLYNYLLYEGFLSKDRSFKFSNSDAEFSPLLGATVFTGKGVCRNIAALLTDILNGSGIYAQNLPIRAKNLAFDEFEYYSDMSGSEKIAKMQLLFTRIVGNHLITYAVHDNRGYYMDPTHDVLYEKRKHNNLVSMGASTGKIKNFSSIFFNSLLWQKGTLSNYLKQQKAPGLSLMEIDRKLDEDFFIPCDLVYDNLDIFENFYNQNKELYADISNKLVLSKKRT